MYSDTSLDRLKAEINESALQLKRHINIMEVCGTHTVSIRRAGIHSLLPSNIHLISGPGCPVCVTSTGYIDNALNLAEKGRAVIATFGDMLKVPGSKGISLSRFIAGGNVRIVYSPLEILNMAGSSDKPIVFLGVGFETTVPTIATTFLRIFKEKRENMFLYTGFKTVPIALGTLLKMPDSRIDAFLLPGHVSVILGEEPYRGVLEREKGVPGVIAGFEPEDILIAILWILRQFKEGTNKVQNAYPRAVRPEGNPKARKIINTLLMPADELWRGLGMLPGSGLSLRPEYSSLNAKTHFGFKEEYNYEPPGCLCSEVLQGKLSPPKCPLFGKKCIPEEPVGPCMVSSEGACAAYYRYGDIKV